MAEYIKNPLSGKLRGVTYEDGKITAVYIRDTDDAVKVFVPMASEKEVLTMTEYIEREALMRRIKEIHCAECDSYHGVRCRACWVDDTLDYIDSEPAADVAQVVHGCWIIGTGENGLQRGYRKCSQCGEIVKYRYSLYGAHNFCNYCGCRMDGGAD